MRVLDVVFVITALAALSVTSPGVAEERLGQEQDIPVAEWREMAMGRTLTYRINGDLWALEHYFPGTNYVALQLYDGTCLQGTWEYSAPLYCYHWDGQGTSCFRHVRQGAQTLVIETEAGKDTAMTQEMTGVSDAPVNCGSAVTS